MVVSQVVAPQTPEMLFVQGNHMIQHLAAATAHPALGYSVLPWTADARANGLDVARRQKPEYMAAKLGITIEQDVFVATWKRQSLPQLLHDPIARGMCRNIEMQDSPSMMLDDEETVEDAERQGGNGEKVTGGNHFAMVLRKVIQLLALPSSPRRFSRCK